MSYRHPVYKSFLCENVSYRHLVYKSFLCENVSYRTEVYEPHAWLELGAAPLAAIHF
jgi:hypothetical protein